MQVLLMAGGGGTRLWPLSTDKKPKQFLALLDNRSLLRTTYARVLPLVSPDNIWLSGNKQHAELLKAELPELKINHLILEPAKKDNAPAICLNQLLMQKAGVPGDEVIVMLPCDHKIGNEDEFRKLLICGEKFLKAHPDNLLTIGIKPTYPETGYGYIEYSEQELDQSIFLVNKFVEKPNYEVAMTYIAQGNFLWNSGIYMWTLKSMLQWFEQFLSDIFSSLSENLDNWENVYLNLQGTSLDYGISEKLQRKIVTIPAQNLDWSDIGDFRALGNYQSANTATLDVSNSYIRNETQVPLRVIGLKNIVVVSTAEGILVCDKDRVQDIKKLN